MKYLYMLVAVTIVAGCSSKNNVDPVVADSNTVDHSTHSHNNQGFDLGLDVPANAKPGVCYGRITIPAEIETVKEKVLVEEGSEVVEVVPAKYGMKDVEVVVKEEDKKLIIIPATYKIVDEEVIISPEKTKLVKVPAKFETRSEKLLVSPARKVWKPGNALLNPNNAIATRSGANGEILCLVEEPAKYKTVSRKVLVTEARTEEQVTPAVTKTIKRTVIDQPARVEERIIPAVTRTIKQKVIIEPAREVKKAVEPKYAHINKQQVVASEQNKWGEIICEDNITTAIISDIQTALRGKGYGVKTDGVFGVATAKALNDYQTGLNIVSNGIALETLDSLGVRY
jgi:hypothetical protein